MDTVSAHNPRPERSGEPGPHTPWAYSLRLPRDPRAAGIARATLRAILGAHDMAQHTDTAELLTGEMVANSYRHTGGPSELRLSCGEPGRLRVGVRDTDPLIPSPFDRPSCPYDHAAALSAAQDAADTGAECGRGLLLVRLCADSWGGYPIRTTPHTTGGKLLWFELTLHHGDPDRYAIVA